MDDCLPFAGYRDKDGYGRVYNKRTKKQSPAHRKEWEDYYGTVLPKEIVVMHICDNPSCINIKHLRLGTQQENIQDKINKERQAKGEVNGSSKLTYRDVKIIKHMLKEKRLRQKEIAKIFNVTQANISSINRGKTWNEDTNVRL